MLPHHFQFLDVFVGYLFLIVDLRWKVAPFYENDCEEDNHAADAANQHHADSPVSS